MLYRSYKPAPPLGNFVHVHDLWFSTTPSGTSQRRDSAERDDGTRHQSPGTYDAVHLEHYKRFSGALVLGACRSIFAIDSVDTSVIGVHFTPAGRLRFSVCRQANWKLHDLETHWVTAAPTKPTVVARWTYDDADGWSLRLLSGIVELARFFEAGPVFHAMPAIRLKHFIRSAESAYELSPSHVVGFLDVGFGGQGGAVFAGINYPF